MSIFHMDIQVEARKKGEQVEERQMPNSPFAQGAFDACRVAGVAMKTEHTVAPSPHMPPKGPGAPRHRRCMSENVIARPKRTSSFQRWKNQMQKAWRWGGSAPEEEGVQSSFNPEILANQKRQWSQLHSRTPEEIQYKEPTSIFEHFIVAGLSPDANLEPVEDAFARRKKWEIDMERSEAMDYPPSRLPPPFPALEPQILFKYPPGKKLGMRVKDLAAFCFPSGVKARLLERSPSLSDLNELVYGQEHLGRDDLSFVFSLKVADNATLYGVCLHVPEIVQRCPGILGNSSPLSQSGEGCCRFLVAAPRCYCILTRVPFFELHYELLQSIIAQERLNRITDFIREMSINEYVPSASRSSDQSPEWGVYPDWTSSAIPVNSAMALTAAAAGMITDDEIPSSSLKTSEPQSPESVTCSESSYFSLAREPSVSDFSQVREALDLGHPGEDSDPSQGRDIDKDSAKNDLGHPREDLDPSQARGTDKDSAKNDLGYPREDSDPSQTRDTDKDNAKNDLGHPVEDSDPSQARDTDEDNAKNDLGHPREDSDPSQARDTDKDNAKNDLGHSREDSDPTQARDTDKDSAKNDLDYPREDSDPSQARDTDKDSAKNSHFDDCASEVSDSRSEIFERICGSYENNNAFTSPETAPNPCKSNKLERVGSTESLIFSPARSLLSDDEDEGTCTNTSPNDFDDECIMEWAKETKNELLQMVCSYHAQPLTPRGSELVFKPLEHLQAITYRRPPITALVYNRKYLETFEPSEVNAKLAAAEEALALSLWTTATICRSLSLQSILALITGVLLEKQVVIVCPNLGVLSATVLSIIPMILPFQWQSLLLPVLPLKMVEFLEAPVPFLVGIQHSTPDLKLKASNLVQVIVLKDQVKSCNLPALPRYKELFCELGPIHARLAAENPVAKRHPVNRCNQVQAQGAAHFLTVMRRYLESICQDLRAHTITSVQSNNDRVSILLKDSFIDSFPTWDRPFIKQFLDTQLFTVLSDTRLSSYENGYD